MQRSCLSAVLGLVLLVCGCRASSADDQLAQLEVERTAYLARIGKVQDETLRGDLERFARMLFWMREAAIENAREPVTAYADPPLRLVDDYGSPDALADTYVSGLLATNEVPYSPEYTEILEPFAYPFEHSIVWRTATLANGSTLPVINATHAPMTADEVRAAADAESPASAVAGARTVNQMNSDRLQTSADDGVDPPPVTRLDGTLTMTIPRRIDRVSFKAGDVGDTRTVGALEVKLESVDGHQATVSIRSTASKGDAASDGVDAPPGADVVMSARDDSGRTLDDSGHAEGPPGAEKDMFKVLDAVIDAGIAGKVIDEAQLEARLEASQSGAMRANGNASWYTTSFRGRVAELDVLLVGMTGSRTRQARLSLVPFQSSVADNAPSLVPIPTAAVVYDPALKALDGALPQELAPGALKKAITISQRGGPKHADGGIDAAVTFEYPPVASDAFISGFDRYEDAHDVVFLDAAGKPIELPGGDDARDALYEFTINRIEYHPKAFARLPVRMTGALEVNRMPVIDKRWIDAASLANGMSIEDNAVIAPASESGEQPVLHAQDRSGRYLKEIAVIRYANDDAPSRYAFHFYGQPARILLLEAGAVEKTPYRFDVVLGEDADDDG